MSLFECMQIPVGFGMALAQNYDALNAFSALDPAARNAVIERSRNAVSNDEMRMIVDDLLRTH